MARVRMLRVPLWLSIIIGIIGLAALFCLIVLIYGGCVGQSFVEVLESWFTNKSAAKTTEDVESFISAVKAYIK